MMKEFEIDDILSAVNSISKINKKKNKTLEKKDSSNKEDALVLNNQIKAKSLSLIK